MNAHTLSAVNRPDSTARFSVATRRCTGATHSRTIPCRGGGGPEDWDERPNQALPAGGAGTGHTWNSKVTPDPLVQGIDAVPAA